MKIKPGPQHEAFRQDVVALLRKHTAHLSADEVLAVASIMVGQILAMQDSRTTTPEMAMDIIAKNIRIGNESAMVELTQRGDQ